VVVRRYGSLERGTITFLYSLASRVVVAGTVLQQVRPCLSVVSRFDAHLVTYERKGWTGDWSFSASRKLVSEGSCEGVSGVVGIIEVRRKA